MSAIIYHASHEQHSPSRLLKLVQLAEQAGFDGIHSSDHFHPWSVRQGHSGFSFSWLGAAMQATRLPFSMVCAPGQRYHPAIVAQAIATLAEMFPDRFEVELGSGEALNEVMTGEEWPAKEMRNQRLLECFAVIKKLLTGQEVTFEGHVKVKEAQIYSLPPAPPPLYCAALSRQTSEWAAPWSDGLLTTAGEIDETADKINAFRNNGGKHKPIRVQYAFSFAETKQKALEAAFDQWRTIMVDAEKLATLYKPEHFDKATAAVKMEELEGKIPLITNITELQQSIDLYTQLDVNGIILHNVNNTSQEAFIEEYGKQVMNKRR
jgi:probable non-F420 flavinoid oxidoreductase